MLALFAIGGLYLTLPEAVSAGPSWIVMSIIAVLIVPLMLSHRSGRHRLNQTLAYTVLSIITSAMIASLGLLIRELIRHQQSPATLLRCATALWVTNVLVFASWYWRLDAGGPHLRATRVAHTDGAFLFPQMTLDDETRKRMGEDRWSPGFVDYLFLAFNTSAAFSPTDVPVLSRWAKGLMMVQASVSLATVAILAARAVNIL